MQVPPTTRLVSDSFRYMILSYTDYHIPVYDIIIYRYMIIWDYHIPVYDNLRIIIYQYMIIQTWDILHLNIHERKNIILTLLLDSQRMLLLYVNPMHRLKWRFNLKVTFFCVSIYPSICQANLQFPFEQ